MSAFELVSHAAPEPPAAILADMIDLYTGDYLSLFESRPLADAFAIEALRVQRGSGASVRDVGHRLREITHVDGRSPERAESMLREAFRPGEVAGVLRLERVAAEADARDGTQLNKVVSYRDMLAPDRTTQRLVVPRAPTAAPAIVAPIT